MTDLGRGAIGIPCREQGRFSTFWQSVMKLDKPPGCLPHPIVRYNNSVAQARNEIAKDALEQDLDWIFWLDDDMLVPKGSLLALLAHPEQIVIGMTLFRSPAGHFRPIWSDQPLEREGAKVIWTGIDAIRTEANGLMRLRSGTGGGVLTRRAVFDTLPAPWWAQGQYDPEMFWEDQYFYDRATEAGFQVWGDPTVRFGHYGSIVLWPHQRADGSWSTVIANGTEGFLEVPWALADPVLA